MIDELYELEEAAAELELISATLYALNIAMCDGKTLVDSNAFVLPCCKLHDISQTIIAIHKKMFDKIEEKKRRYYLPATKRHIEKNYVNTITARISATVNKVTLNRSPLFFMWERIIIFC